jgi:hypothetical protein
MEQQTFRRIAYDSFVFLSLLDDLTTIIDEEEDMEQESLLLGLFSLLLFIHQVLRAATTAR